MTSDRAINCENYCNNENIKRLGRDKRKRDGEKCAAATHLHIPGRNSKQINDTASNCTSRDRYRRATAAKTDRAY